MDTFKSAFTSAPGLTHLNNAGFSRSSLPAIEAMRLWTERFYREGVHCIDDHFSAIEGARRRLAALAACDSGEIAFFQGTAGAISQVAFGLDLKPQDEVVLWDQEYGSNLFPWVQACERSGATIQIVESPSDLSAPLEKLLEHVTPQTKVIAVSWVQYQTGSVTDLKALADFARARGILTVVDIIQGFGARPFNFQELGIDFACGGSHKWMVSPVGVGFLIVRKEHIEKLKPIMVGMRSMATTDAAKFEPGSQNGIGIVALGASADLIRRVGVPSIQEESEHLGITLRHGLKDMGYRTHENASSSKAFVTFSHDTQNIQDISEVLKKTHIAHVFRGPGIRLSPHAHNNEEDIYKTLHVLKGLL